MKDLAEQFVKEMNDAMDALMRQTGVSVLTLKDVDNDDFVAIKAGLKLLDTSNKLIIKQAEIMDEMNKKLDTLLSRVKEA